MCRITIFAPACPGGCGGLFGKIEKELASFYPVKCRSLVLGDASTDVTATARKIAADLNIELVLESTKFSSARQGCQVMHHCYSEHSKLDLAVVVVRPELMVALARAYAMERGWRAEGLERVRPGQILLADLAAELVYAP